MEKLPHLTNTSVRLHRSWDEEDRALEGSSTLPLRSQTQNQHLPQKEEDVLGQLVSPFGGDNPPRFPQSLWHP